MSYPPGFSDLPQEQKDAYFAGKNREWIEEARHAGTPAASRAVFSMPSARADNGKPSAPSWPEPKPIEATLPAVAAFDPELLPSVLRDYVFDVADRQQSPPDFVAVAVLCGLAALIGNKARIRPKQYDDWEVVLNLWGALIGLPSMMKSPAMRAALAALYALQDNLRKQWEAEQREADMEDVLSNLDAKDAKKRAEKALKAGDRDEAKRLIKEANGGGDREEVPCPRLVVCDATVEKLGELMNENPRGLLLVRDELPGLLARLESEEFQSERAFYLESFNGDGSFTFDRIGRGTVHIENATLSIIGGIQPSRIAPLVRGAISGKCDDGLIQRLQLAVWPDAVASWKYTDRRPCADARQNYEDAFRRLYDFASKIEEPAVFGFSATAQEMFKTWMTEIQTEARSGKLPTVLESHLLKMPKTICSIALIFHLLDGGEGPVSEKAAARAFDWADYLRTHANRLYSAGSTMAESSAKLMIERRAQLPESFTARDVRKKSWAGLSDHDAVADAIDMLIDAGYCREAPPAASTAGGRPTIAYVWNPRLKSEG